MMDNKISIRVLLVTVIASSCALSAVDKVDTFHLKNNSQQEIKIDITQSGRSVLDNKWVTLAPGKSFPSDKSVPFSLDIEKPTALQITYCATAKSCKEGLQEKIIARFNEGKNIYIKFDGKTITPQKGGRFSKKTTSGYSMENNVEAGDITVISDVKKRTLN